MNIKREPHDSDSPPHSPPRSVMLNQSIDHSPRSRSTSRPRADSHSHSRSHSGDRSRSTDMEEKPIGDSTERSAMQEDEEEEAMEVNNGVEKKQRPEDSECKLRLASLARKYANVEKDIKNFLKFGKDDAAKLKGDKPLFLSLFVPPKSARALVDAWVNEMPIVNSANSHSTLIRLANRNDEFISGKLNEYVEKREGWRKDKFLKNLSEWSKYLHVDVDSKSAKSRVRMQKSRRKKLESAGETWSGKHKESFAKSVIGVGRICVHDKDRINYLTSTGNIVVVWEDMVPPNTIITLVETAKTQKGDTLAWTTVAIDRGNLLIVNVHVKPGTRQAEAVAKVKMELDYKKKCVKHLVRNLKKKLPDYTPVWPILHELQQSGPPGQ